MQIYQEMHFFKQYASREQHSSFLQLQLRFSLDSGESIFTLLNNTGHIFHAAI